MTFPQLRTRTEFNFKNSFGPISSVANALTDLNCPAAAMVDVGTWGHAQWAKHLAKTSVKPLFGTEIVVPQEDGKKPSCWVLAEDMRHFYNLSTAALKPGADIEALLCNTPGVIRFAGAALTNPFSFDYIDLNPASPLQQRRALELHAKTKRPLVVTSDNAYPRKSDYNAFMAFTNRERITPQHILSEAELRAGLPCLTDEQFHSAVMNCHEIAERCATTLPTAPIIKVDADFRYKVQDGKLDRLAVGHIKEWTREYEDRLQREVAMIEQKQFESYFLVVADLMEWAKQRMLCGPGRGSSSGSLVCYLLRITEIDPLQHGLLFERFIDASRGGDFSSLPDIDLDFSDTKREQVFTYLAEKYGADKVARIGNISKMKARSALARICEKLAINDSEKFSVVDVLVEHSEGDTRFGFELEDTFTQTEPGRRFAARHPEVMGLLAIENHASHTSVHAAGVIVCNEPISDFCTVGVDGVMQGDKPYAEAVNLLKIDALGLTTLGVIEDAGCVTADQLYALTFDDPKVLTMFNSHRYTGIFQFEGGAQRRIAEQIDIKSFREINHIVALARPGPMGGGATNHYIDRAAGREASTYHHASMKTYLEPTYGIILFQEQVMRICAEIGQFDWKEVSAVRKLISLRKGEEALNVWLERFVSGAAQIGVPKTSAERIWGEMVSFGSYGFNESHSVAYGAISYYTAWMKTYHPLEYAAACLRKTSDENQTLALLRDMHNEGVDYVPFDIERSAADWSVVDGVLIGGFKNLVGFGPAKSATAIEQRNAGKLDPARIAKAQIKFAELYPLMAAYGELYRHPERFGCQDGSVVVRLNNLPQEGDTLTIGRVVKTELRDENEKARIDRREGRRMEGKTLFLNVMVADDTGETITLRVDRKKFEPFGRIIFERVQVGDDLLIRGSRIPGFGMLKVLRMKVLNREVEL